MKKLLIAILLIGGVFLAYLGVTTYQDATASVNVLGLELSAQDQESQQTAFLYGFGALVCVVASLWLYRR